MRNGAPPHQGEQAFGVEMHSLAVDPLFVDFEQGNLGEPELPAPKLGFEPVMLPRSACGRAIPSFRAATPDAAAKSDGE